MDKNEFYEHIKESFFEDLTADFDGFKNMVSAAMPVFGTLETKITKKEEGMTIEFIDVDEAQIIVLPEGVSADEVDTDMTATFMTLHLDENNIIKAVEHGMHLFTPANKKQALLLASFIGKKITFE